MMFEEACEPDYQYDEKGEIVKDAEGNPVEYPKTSWGYDNWNVDIYAAGQEEIDGIRTLIEIARPLFQESAEEVAKIIQSRVWIYVSKNS